MEAMQMIAGLAVAVALIAWMIWYHRHCQWKWRRERERELEERQAQVQTHFERVGHYHPPSSDPPGRQSDAVVLGQKGSLSQQSTSIHHTGWVKETDAVIRPLPDDK